MSGKYLTYSYFAISCGKIVSDEFSTPIELQENMRNRGYYPWEWDFYCLCEEWLGDSPLRHGTGSTQREARLNLSNINRLNTSHMVNSNLHFRLSFRKSPITADRVVFYSPRLFLIEPLLLASAFYGHSPLLSVVYLDEGSNPDGFYLSNDITVKRYIRSFFPDYII